MKRLCIAALAWGAITWAALAAATPAAAAIMGLGEVQISAVGDVLLTMNDLPNQPVNGLVHPAGVTFGFTIGGVGNLDARYNSGGPGSLTFVQDPSIEGASDGVLSLNFATPTPLVQFGIARSTTSTLVNGAVVQLFNAANASLGTTNLTLQPLLSFAEAQFAYTGADVKRVTISFPSPAAATRFAFDNLLFHVPEPAAPAVMFVGTVTAACARGRRRRRR